MLRHRARLPQLEDRLFLTDGGIETTLLYHDGLDLPDFAAYRLLDDLHGELALVKYFHSYLEVARRHRTGIVLETATWRANSDWGARLGHDAADLVRLNQSAVLLLEHLRGHFAAESGPIVISGCVGPRGDGYIADRTMTAREARDYHAAQVNSFASTSVDLVSAITMTTAEEAIGIVLAAREAGLPSIVSFTVETDGSLPTGQPLSEAIEQVDRETAAAAAYYMINCAHPSHFASVLDAGAAWSRRLRGVRVNASCRSHAELNRATALDAGDMGDIDALARDTAALRDRLPHLTVFGGCCGTDHRHIAAMARVLEPRFVQATVLP